ncbi:cell division protein ZapA [Hwanghaeella grinnelliae]|uniref:Cell division protein ZapA n=1 Tax=Hwanghaeella grinnelliae TaxID=2500179 RepID=A0A3S2WP40_9PROT|nr:cell division protein ZapA [Hwanghaeella grinnelliae]RVU33773.1 cell division protein ZapA [Hwanghaeella grinnelliae]
MAQVDIIVNGRNYSVACDDGQEEHLHRLAAYLDKRVGELSASMGQLGDARLLVMAGLLISDELSECFEQIKSLRAELDAVSEAGPAPTPAEPVQDDSDLEVLESLAERLETVAEKLADA